MIQQTIFRSLLLSAAIALGTSCSTYLQTDKVEYQFAEGVNHRKLVLTIPDGFESETHSRDENGVLIRTFHYKNGAEFFIACKDNELNPFIAIERTESTSSDLQKSLGEEGTGKNANGTSWRRTLRDCFIVGYDFVDPAQAKAFDRAIQSLKVRRA
jgi:hypothetical protein